MEAIEKLKQEIQAFCEERDWDQYHNPKDLAIGISTEANELLDIFRFKSEQDMQELLSDPTRREAVGHELADVLFFLLRFSQMYEFDLFEELRSKMELNKKKYPVDTSKGSNRKYNE